MAAHVPALESLLSDLQELVGEDLKVCAVSA